MAEKPPGNSTGAVAWIRQNLFSSVPNSIMTLLSIAFLAWIIPPLAQFLIFKAIWVDPLGQKGDLCRPEGVGACWAFVSARFSFFLFGFYPLDQLWRPSVVMLSGLALIIPLFTPKAPFKVVNAVLFFVVLPIVSYILLAGGLFGLNVGDD
eukprot:gene58503-78042_t